MEHKNNFVLFYLFVSSFFLRCFLCVCLSQSLNVICRSTELLSSNKTKKENNEIFGFLRTNNNKKLKKNEIKFSFLMTNWKTSMKNGGGDQFFVCSKIFTLITWGSIVHLMKNLLKFHYIFIILVLVLLFLTFAGTIQSA